MGHLIFHPCDIRGCALGVIVALCGFHLQAQEGLTLDECLIRAKSSNPDLTQAEMTYEKARIQKDASIAPYLPQVSTTLSATRQSTDTSAMTGGGTGAGSTTVTNNNFNVGLNIKQNIFAGFRDRYTSQKRNADVVAAEASRQQSHIDLDYAVRNAFFEQLYLQELVDLAKQTVKRREENLRLVNLRFQAGRENKGAYLKSHAALTEALANQDQAERNLAIARQQLAILIGEKSPGRIIVKGTFDINALQETPDFEALAIAMPSYKEALAQAKSARLGIDIAHAEAYPSIDLTSGVMRNADTWPPDQNTYSVGVSLTLPIYSGGSQVADVRSAVADSTRAGAQVESTRRKLVMDIARAYGDLKESVQRMKVQEENAQAAKVRAQIAQNQYDLGLISFQDWDMIENEKISSENLVLSAREQMALSNATWEKNTRQ